MNLDTTLIDGSIYASQMLGNAASMQYQSGCGVVWAIDEHKHAWYSFGKEDNVPYLLREAYRKSTIHSTAVNAKANLIAGAGFEFNPLEEYYKRDEYGQYELVKQKPNADIVKKARLIAKNIGLEYFRSAASAQLALYGGYYALRAYGLDRMGKPTLQRLYVERSPNVRMGTNRKWMDGQFHSTEYLFSEDWTSATPYNPVSYEKYRSGKGDVAYLPGEGFAKGKGMRVKFCGRVSDYRNYYPTPDYESLDAMTYINIDYMLSQHDYKTLESGFSLNHIIVRYRKEMDTAEGEKAKRDEELKLIKNKFKGFNGEKSMITWVEPRIMDDGKVDTPEMWKVIEIPHNNNAERHNILREERMIKILNAHNVITGEITGLPRLGKTGFSSQAEFLIAAQQQLHWSVIAPMQQIIEKDLEDMFIQLGCPVSVKIKRSAAALRVMTDELLKWAFSKDETRTIYGYDRMSEEVAKELLNNE